eukprot:EG_transcript_42557
MWRHGCCCDVQDSQGEVRPGGPGRESQGPGVPPPSHPSLGQHQREGLQVRGGPQRVERLLPLGPHLVVRHVQLQRPQRGGGPELRQGRGPAVCDVVVAQVQYQRLQPGGVSQLRQPRRPLVPNTVVP